MTETESISKENVMNHRDDEGARMGMWIFLFTEIFFFGTLFLVYAVYRYMHPAEFHAASLHLDTFIGAMNTAILLTSSMTMSMAVTALKQGNHVLSSRLIAVTLLLAFFFLLNKFFEWDHKFLLNIYPGSDLMLSLNNGYVLFFGLYFFMTGLHALHIVVGIVLLSVCYVKVKKQLITSGKIVLLQNSTLYWHLVDLIWIFLFPLLYLIT
jgi:cytochrome c oxidase subunit III